MGLGVIEGVRQLDGNRFQVKAEDGTEIIIGGLSKSELKTAFVLEQNVAQFFHLYPIEKIGFMTVTFPKSVTTPKQASRRFNSFRTNHLKDLTDDYIKVTEPHKDKRPHYHLLVALREDIRTGFDWESHLEAEEEYAKNKKSERHRQLTKKYSLSATSYLRNLWSEFRKAKHRYLLGRIQLLPIRKSGEAAVKYVSKYIEKGCGHRVGPWKGVRLTSNSRSFNRAANCRFSWVVAATGWREYVAEFAKQAGIKGIGDMERVMGKRWAFKVLLCMSRQLEVAEAIQILRPGINW